MHGLMQDRALTTTSIIEHASRHHPCAEIVSRTESGALHRTTYREIERRMRRLARALPKLGVQAGDRVGTLAWNGFRHLELYYAVPGIGAICHTINPRLGVADIAYIVEDAGDAVLFVEPDFAGLVEALAARLALRHVVILTEAARMPDLSLPPGTELHCYEALLAAEGEDFAWPAVDEAMASSLCYTSGTTGRPKGVLYSHRSTVLHAYAANMADAFGLRATDRVMPVVPMFHVNAWGSVFAAPMAGAALVMPGRHLDGASVASLMNEERVTCSAGVPTVWLGLLTHLRASGTRLDTVRSLTIGGSACPPMLIEAFAREYGVRVDHAWGMTETSPLGTYNYPGSDEGGMAAADVAQRRLTQGRPLFGLEMKIVDDSGAALPWDGVAFGNLLVRGHWVCNRYFGRDTPGGADESGWFATGDVATIDPGGFMRITDRSKDVIKSGGEWISSITLENIAVAHPDVAEAAIIAARHPKWDERPLLLVVAREGHALDTESVMASFQGQVPKWWTPDVILQVPELPHTATGKLNKVVLRAQYGQYFAQNDAA